MIMMQCYLIFHAAVSFQASEEVKRYSVVLAMGLALKEAERMNYVHIMNHLTVMGSAVHMQITLVMISQLIVMV
jgi:hypothetical protein